MVIHCSKQAQPNNANIINTENIIFPPFQKHNLSLYISISFCYYYYIPYIAVYNDYTAIFYNYLANINPIMKGLCKE